MTAYLSELLQSLGTNANFAVAISVLILILSIATLAWMSNFIAKKYIVRLLRKRLSRAKSKWAQAAVSHQVFLRLSHLAPAVVIYSLTPMIVVAKYPATEFLSKKILMLTIIYMLIVVTLTLSALLNSLEEAYRSFEVAKQRPIKSYLQVAKIALYIIVSIIIISTLINKSPTVLLTSLGAVMAIILLIFKDSILGFVASIQLSTHDMVHLGDWITVPQYGADGDIVDMSLHTVKVQNFDKTIVTMPTYALLNQGVKNWRGMKESGGRRIKRSINIDMDSIKFCDEEMLNRFRKIHYISDHIENKLSEISAYNKEKKVDLSTLDNGRHLTNLGVYRAYINAYLLNNNLLNLDSVIYFLFIAYF